MSEEDDTYSTIFTSLKHPIRRKILRRLQSSPATYTELLNELQIENGLLNYHLESVKELLTKQEDGRYTLNEFGKAGVQLLHRVEEPVNSTGVIESQYKTNRTWFGSKQLLGVIAILIIGIASLSGLSFLLYDNYMANEKALNDEISSLNGRITELSLFESLINMSKPPQPLYAGNGVQVVSSYPIEFDYFPGNYMNLNTIITLYVPLNSSTIGLDIVVDPFSSSYKLPLNVTLQKGNAWINQTWVKVKTKTIIDNRNITVTSVRWQSPVIWSMNTTESGIYHTPQLSEGWYTLSMFGPVFQTTSNFLSGPQTSTPYPRYYLERVGITSYRVIMTVTVLNDKARGFFAMSSDWFR